MKKAILLLCMVLLVGCAKPIIADRIVEEPTRSVIYIANAQTMVDIFENNEMDGNSKYGNEWIHLTAYFSGMEYVDYGSYSLPVAYFNTKAKLNGFIPSFGCEILVYDEEYSKIAKFDIGQAIVFVGKLSKKDIHGYLLFDFCEYPDY